MSKLINCIIVDDEPVAREILENHLGKIAGIHIVGSCKNAVEAFNLINLHTIDLVFLDINMPEISGLSFARSINKNIKIIFQILIKMGHLQPPTPIQTDNTTARDIITIAVKHCKTRLMDMRFYWLQD